MMYSSSLSLMALLLGVFSQTCLSTETSGAKAEVNDSSEFPPVALILCGVVLFLILGASVAVYVKCSYVMRKYSDASLASSRGGKRKGVSRDTSTTSLAKKSKAVTRETSTTSLGSKEQGSLEDALEKGFGKDVDAPEKQGSSTDKACAALESDAEKKEAVLSGSTTVQLDSTKDKLIVEASSVTVNDDAGLVSEWSTPSVAEALKDAGFLSQRAAPSVTEEQDAEELNRLSEFMVETSSRELMFLTAGAENKNAATSPGDNKGRTAFKI